MQPSSIRLILVPLVPILLCTALQSVSYYIQYQYNGERYFQNIAPISIIAKNTNVEFVLG